MGYNTRQGIGVARLVETKATRLPSVREVDKCKSAFGHAVLQWCYAPSLGASEVFDISAFRLRHRDMT
jgi:hypothetical protein